MEYTNPGTTTKPNLMHDIIVGKGSTNFNKAITAVVNPIVTVFGTAAHMRYQLKNSKVLTDNTSPKQN